VFKWIKRHLVPSASVEVLPYPYPYQGMLALNSDVEFTSWQTQLDLIEFFANQNLDVSFSFWGYGDLNLTWCLFDEANKLTPYAKQFFPLARRGWFDTIHSFAGMEDGQGTTLSRERFCLFYKILREEGITPGVYTNHGGLGDTQNIGGSWASYQQGDVAHHSHYHLDLTLQHGVRFFWTDIDYDNNHRTFRLSSDQTSPNPPLFKTQVCRDGNKILRFKRHRGNLSYAPSLDNLVQQLKPFVETPPKGFSIVYQHLGVKRNDLGRPYSAASPYFNEEAHEIWKAFSRLQKEGTVLISSTEKLLRYALLQEAKPWIIHESGTCIRIELQSVAEFDGILFTFQPEDFGGVTFKLPQASDVKIIYNKNELPYNCLINQDGSYAQIPWPSLTNLG
jgi:hypothetical protein